MAVISSMDLDFIIEPQTRQFCGPLFFTTSLETAKGNIPNNGSFGLVNTGKKKLLVACQHVWEQFKNQRSENPELKFAVCLDVHNPVVMEPDSLLIDEDKRADLVTFDMESLLPACKGLDFYNLQKSPPPKINVGEFLFFIGFPGKGREATSSAVGFSRQPCGVVATEVGKFHFYSNVSNLKKEVDDFAGMSGSPCFLVKGQNPIRLVGFVTGYALNRLSFAYAKQINTDGTIVRIY